MFKSFVKNTIVTAGVIFASVVATEGVLAGSPAPSAQSGANAGAAARQAQGQNAQGGNANSSSRSKVRSKQKQTTFNGGNRLSINKNIINTGVGPGNQWGPVMPQGSCVDFSVQGGASVAPREGYDGETNLNPVLNIMGRWQPGSEAYCKWSDNLQSETQKAVQEIRGQYNVKITVLEKKYQMSLEAVKACLQQRLQQGLPIGPNSCQNQANQVNQGRQTRSSSQPQPQQQSQPQPQPEAEGPGSN